MNITSFSRENPPSREDMEKIGASLLASLSGHLGLKLLSFKEFYVEEGSVVLTFRSAEPVHKALGIQIEGVLMFDVRSGGAPPSVETELLLFSCGKRMGLQMNKGKSYLQIKYDVSANSWREAVWFPDVPEEWERVTELRESQYAEVVKTYDFTE